MNDDVQLLADVPDFLIGTGAFLKATPATEGERRVCFFEASNEGRDLQNEVVASKALAESAPYFLQYGNIDIDHLTLIGPKLGIPDHMSYEIGRPVDVGQRGDKTFVKAEIFRGEGPAAVKANQFWSSITDIDPPTRWYPSVAGTPLEKSIEVDPKTMARKATIKRVRWTNIGVSRTPVNPHVPTVATTPIGTFMKALVAGYGADSATLEGGGALRAQSLYGGRINYFDFRNRITKAVQDGRVGDKPLTADLCAYAAREYGLSGDEATEHVERFTRDLKHGLSKRRSQ